MHILQIPISLPRQRTPTSGIYIVRLAECQLSSRHIRRSNLIGVEFQPVIYTGYQLLRRKKTNWITTNTRSAITKNIPTIRSYSKRHAQGNIKYSYAILDLFEEYVAKNGYLDIIHAHSGRGAGLAAVFIKVCHGIPFVVTEHNSDFLTGSLSQDQPQLQFVYDQAQQIYVVSEGMNNGINQVVSYETRVFPHTLDSTFLHLNSIKERDGPPYFLSVGRLTTNRDQQLVINALDICRTKLDCDYRLTIVGTGDKEQELRSMFEEKSLEHLVKFLVYCSQSELKALYKKATATLICSNLETFGLPIIKSLSCGTQVISTPTSGTSTIYSQIRSCIHICQQNSRYFQTVWLIVSKKMILNPLVKKLRSLVLISTPTGSDIETYAKSKDHIN